jgi:hypothetical protein
MFKYLLQLPDRPATRSRDARDCRSDLVGDVITVGRGEQLRVIAIHDFPHAELVEQDVRAIFTVEPGLSSRT